MRGVALEAEAPAGPRGRTLLLHIGGEVQHPERDRGVGHGLAARVDDAALDDAVVVGRHMDVPYEDCRRDRAGNNHEATEKEPFPARRVVISFAHPFVAPEVRPRMNSFWARRKSRMPGASTMMTKA